MCAFLHMYLFIFIQLVNSEVLISVCTKFHEIKNKKLKRNVKWKCKCKFIHYREQEHGNVCQFVFQSVRQAVGDVLNFHKIYLVGWFKAKQKQNEYNQHMIFLKHVQRFLRFFTIHFHFSLSRSVSLSTMFFVWLILDRKIKVKKNKI